jgi:integron integrase
MHDHSPRLLQQVRFALRRKHYSYRTERAYLEWIRRFILFHHKRHPSHLGRAEVESFLTDLAVTQNVASSTQNQALNALAFLYKVVLDQPLDFPLEAVRARRPKRLPTVLSKDEVFAVLGCMNGTLQLIAQLLYGSGLRVGEAVRLRVKDVDFSQSQIVVRDTKGNRDRLTMLPVILVPSLRSQLVRVKRIHEMDLDRGHGLVYLPTAIERKYPEAARAWIWQYVFPSHSISNDPRTGIPRRHHITRSALQKAVKRAADLAGIAKHVTPHTFRHSFATHLLEAGYDIRTVQDLLGHKNVQTTMVYTHVLNRGGMAVRSPLDGVRPTASSRQAEELGNSTVGLGVLRE